MSKPDRSKKGPLGLEIRKHKRKSSEIISYVLMLFGAILLMASIIYESSIFALIALGLAFWGGLLLFIRPTKLVKINLLDASVISSLTAIDHMIGELKYKGKAIYLPPRYLKELKSGTIFIPYKKEIVIPPVEEVVKEKVFLKNPNGMCLTPPGLGLVNLFEKELEKDFTKVDLNYLKNHLPPLFIEDLEIAENLEINTKGNVIQVKITGSIYKDFCKGARRLPNICGSVGSPLCSSIACALSRVTGKPVIIEKFIHSKDDKTIEAYYRVLKSIKKFPAPSRARKRRSMDVEE